MMRGPIVYCRMSQSVARPRPGAQGTRWVSANIEETHIRKVRDGQPVTITVDAYPHQTFDGKVTQLGAATRSEFALIPAGSASAHFIKVTQRIPVRIAIENPNSLLKPGMMVEVG